ncbi:MAG: adenylosuccinate synthase [Desulfovibrio sp.]|jgi:adenylosuccinate synthase|nr:adenylosuccinate synthase [Desulfovibrio sp.]MBQ1539885.1 adenylosuccinate synthase [Desulfovibrio sp.]MBQ2516054.1 adenylosuccinate synthase [Desulfovibrio sp.]MCR5170772.1 adenylosuccinate synthase [Desulfovibrio sp.]
MANTVIIGSQWGDEGKGKIVDMLSSGSDVIVRFQGGNNAGHTIKVNGHQTILHTIPSGILHPGKLCLVGNGVVLDPFVFLQEVDELKAQSVDVSPSRLGISPKTHLILPYHRAIDMAREAMKKGKKIGTTGRGIGPCYEDKAARIGLRCGDLLNPDLVRSKIRTALQEKNVLFANLYHCDVMDADKVADEILGIADRMTPYLRDVSEAIQDAVKSGKVVLWEGAQGVHLDIDHGTYPYVTSSNTVAGYASTGSGIGPDRITRTVGIVKAYTTRVGSGPFPTELENETGKFLQENGHEFGATTGRPRRCGWLDAVVIRETARLCGLTDIALTKVDVLRGLPTLKICVDYEYKGERIAYPPQGENALAEVKPIYEELPGFSEDITGCRAFAALPGNVQKYIKRIEALTGVKVSIVSVGADREETIER